MTPRNDWKELLIRYHSGELDAATRALVEQQLRLSPELQQHLNHLQEIDRFLQQRNRLEQPSKNFADRVMHGVSLPARSQALSPKMGLILLSSILVLTLVGLVMLMNGYFDSLIIPLNVNLESWSFEKFPTPNFNFPFPSKWVVTAFLILNMVVGFILLDRTILKPFFQRRAEAFQ